MHLVIISGATRPQSKSNTAKVIAAFQKGFEENGNTTEVWYLSDRRQWKRAANAFEQNERILIAFPLYVENIPGILLEFLSGITPKQAPGTKLAFLIQGGFPEASQSRCCEAFLETLPAQLGCEYAGTRKQDLRDAALFEGDIDDEKNYHFALGSDPLPEHGSVQPENGARFRRSGKSDRSSFPGGNREDKPGKHQRRPGGNHGCGASAHCAGSRAGGTVASGCGKE